MPYQTDRANTLQVSMTAGTPASVSELDMLGGANRALVIDPDGAVEVIAWANATHAGGGSRTYTLDTLLRGQSGTESFTGCHVIGSMLLVVDEAVDRRLVPLAELGEARHYKAVGRGGFLSDAPRKQITPVGRDLMPRRPVQLQSNGASWGSNITLGWRRQTRVGGEEWFDFTSDVPLAEDAEAYELEILDGQGGAVLRTVTGLTTESFVYTTAMQSADFGGAQTELTFRVYQVSAQVGRGFASEDTLATDPFVQLYALAPVDGSNYPAAQMNYRPVGDPIVVAAANTQEYSNLYSIAEAFGGVLPDRIKLAVENRTGLAMSNTADECELYYVLVYANLQGS